MAGHLHPISGRPFEALRYSRATRDIKSDVHKTYKIREIRETKNDPEPPRFLEWTRRADYGTD